MTEGNYTKRKHVFKLTSDIASASTGNIASPSSLPVVGTEILIQTDSQQDMKLWMDTLKMASCSVYVESFHINLMQCGVYFVMNPC